jgi:hypothetical protein
MSESSCQARHVRCSLAGAWDSQLHVLVSRGIPGHELHDADSVSDRDNGTGPALEDGECRHIVGFPARISQHNCWIINTTGPERGLEVLVGRRGPAARRHVLTRQLPGSAPPRGEDQRTLAPSLLPSNNNDRAFPILQVSATVRGG